MAGAPPQHASIAQVAVMAALVATILYFPLTVPLAIGFRLAGVSFQGFVTFGGAFNIFFGLAAWWLLVFVAACVYAVCLFPRDDKVLGWPKKK